MIAKFDVAAVAGRTGAVRRSVGESVFCCFAECRDRTTSYGRTGTAN